MPTLAATANHLGYPSMSVGGVADHVHVVCGLNRTLSVATLVAKLKVSSNQVLKGKFLLCLGLVDIGRHSSGPTGLAVVGVKIDVDASDCTLQFVMPALQVAVFTIAEPGQQKD